MIKYQSRLYGDIYGSPHYKHRHNHVAPNKGCHIIIVINTTNDNIVISINIPNY